MANPFTKLANSFYKPIQELFNNSYDSDFNENTMELIGYDSSTNNIKRILATTNGALIVATGSDVFSIGALNSASDSVSNEGHTPTYSAAGSFVPAGIGDVIGLLAISTVYGRVTRLRLSARASSGNGALEFAIKYSASLPTGGTPVQDTALPHYSGNAAAQLKAYHWTAAPTEGTATPFRYGILPVYSAGSTNMSAPPELVFEFGVDNEQSFQLPLSTTATFLVNLTSLGGLTAANIIIDYSITWTEATS